MIDLNTWARLPLVLGFPAFAKPLIAMRQAVEAMEKKLRSIQLQFELIEAEASVATSVLEAYEAKIESILKEVVAYRRRIIAASVKFALTKIKEVQLDLMHFPERATPQAIKKFVIMCRSLSRKVSAELHRGVSSEREVLVELADALEDCLSVMLSRKQPQASSEMSHRGSAVTVNLN